jgi:hypothetical protein
MKYRLTPHYDPDPIDENFLEKFKTLSNLALKIL